MPPRTRTQTTAPAGRRPKVAGLRAPGKPGVTAESPGPSGPADDEPDEPDTALADTAAPEAPAADDAPEESPASDDVAGTAEAGTAPASPKPSSKARRTAEAGPAAGTRSGTTVLDRPTRPERERPAPREEDRPSRTARIGAAITRPFRALGANPKRLTVVLAVVLVVCLALATVAFLAARSDRAEGQPFANQAVVDVGGTAEVVGQTRQAMEQILSYDYTKLDDSVNAAKAQSTGAFQSQYLGVFEQTIRGPATQQKLRQTASVLNIGVQQLSGDHATLMALVQFTAERTTNQQTTNAPGLLTVQMVREDGRWKIAELKPM